MAIEAYLVMAGDKPHSVYLDFYQAEYEARRLVGSVEGVVSIRTMQAVEPTIIRPPEPPSCYGKYIGWVGGDANGERADLSIRPNLV